MTKKQRILWGLAAIAVVGAFVCWRANVIGNEYRKQQQAFVHEAAQSVLNRKCVEPANLPAPPNGFVLDESPDCRFAKNLGASLVDQFSWQSDVSSALRYVASSGKYLNRGGINDYARVNSLIAEFQKDRDDVAVMNTILNGFMPTKNEPRFDVQGFLSRVESIEAAHDKANDVALGSGGIATLAALPLLLIGLWELFLAMVRSFRRAWNNPNG
jgi:hypothetical protein